MGVKGLLKRPAFIAFVVVLVLLILVAVRIHTYAWPWLTLQPIARVACEEVAWSMALTIDMTHQLETFYVQHAEALLAARKGLPETKDTGQILRDLSLLPGVKASFVAEIGGAIEQYPASSYPLDDLQPQINEYEEEATMYDHPIMLRKVNGLTRFVKWKAGQDSLDFMVCYGQKEDPEKRVLGLVLDPPWLLNQIPAFMDSITKQDELLLFFSRRTPGVAEQTIGITFKGDTLWWDNNPSLEVKYYSNPAWLLNDLWLHGRMHAIHEEEKNAQHMPWIRRWFASAEILGIVALGLALFAIRPKKQDKD